MVVVCGVTALFAMFCFSPHSISANRSPRPVFLLLPLGEKVFAPNEVTGASQFWYLMHQMRKMKKTTGEILDIVEVRLRGWAWGNRRAAAGGGGSSHRFVFVACTCKHARQRTTRAYTATSPCFCFVSGGSFFFCETVDGEELPHHQELRHLAPLRLPLRHAQHVPRVQGPHPDRRRGPDV